MDRYFCKQISPIWLDNLDVQGRNKVGRRLGQKTSLALPCSNLRSFGSKCTVVKEVLMSLLWLFGPPQWFGVRGIVPLAPLVTPLVMCNKNRKIFRKETNFQVRTSRTSIPWTSGIFEHNTPWPCNCTHCQQGYWRHFMFLRVVFVSLLCLP